MPVASLGTGPFTLHCEGSGSETSQWHDYNEIHILRLYRGNTGTMADPFVLASLGLAPGNRLSCKLPIAYIHYYSIVMTYRYLPNRCGIRI